MEANKFEFIHPTRCLISGPSGCGKTEFIQQVISNRFDLFTVAPKRIVYTYKYPQVWFSKFPEVEFKKEVPNDLDPEVPSMVVLDDIVCDAVALKKCASLFVRGSHHLNTSVFFITQNLFAPSSDFRTISLNATQFVLFKTVRGIHQIELLGRQIFGSSQTQEFMDAYKDATNQPYSYLLIDLHPTQEHRLRTSIFPSEEEIIYVLNHE